MRIQEIVNNEEWQSLRKSMKGTWKRKPGENCHRLKEYLGQKDDYLKLRRVLNYLTGSGFRSGVISHPDINKLKIEVKIKLKEYEDKR